MSDECGGGTVKEWILAQFLDDQCTSEMEEKGEPKQGNILMGPILLFQGEDKDYCYLDIVALCYGIVPPVLKSDTLRGAEEEDNANRESNLLWGRPIYHFDYNRIITTVWKFSLRVEQEDEWKTHAYFFSPINEVYDGGANDSESRKYSRFEFAIPGRKEHLRIACISGNKFARFEPYLREKTYSDSAIFGKKDLKHQTSKWGSEILDFLSGSLKNNKTPPSAINSKNMSCWRDLNKRNEKDRFHLLVHLGNQINISPWEALKIDKRNLLKDSVLDRKWNAEDVNNVELYFLRNYCRVWNLEPVAKLLATIPNVMIWDDTDIFPYWGSYDGEYQDSNLFRGFFEVARRIFCIFQLGTNPDEPIESHLRIANSPGYSLAFTLNRVGFMILDERSERNRSQVLGPETFQSVKKYLQSWSKFDDPLQYLFLVSPSPVILCVPSAVHASSTDISRKSKQIHNPKYLECIDSWTSDMHQSQRILLIKMLIEYSNNSPNTKIVVLSGRPKTEVSTFNEARVLDHVDDTRERRGGLLKRLSNVSSHLFDKSKTRDQRQDTNNSDSAILVIEQVFCGPMTAENGISSTSTSHFRKHSKSPKIENLDSHQDMEIRIYDTSASKNLRNYITLTWNEKDELVIDSLTEIPNNFCTLKLNPHDRNATVSSSNINGTKSH